MKFHWMRIAVLFAAAEIAPAHCDTVDGPVVTAARQALEKGDAGLVLHWVRKADEGEVRKAFEETLAVRMLNAQSRGLADRYFFETVVRVQRAGEGAPYTGLKPAGSVVDPGIIMAGQAVDNGSAGALIKGFSRHMESDLRKRFERVAAAKSFRPGEIGAGREYAAPYVDFIHYVEAVHNAIAARGHAH
jgi:hypothetical protein